jgi:divalent metal cation (Fe/Co/Zn/Cd) transporter
MKSDDLGMKVSGIAIAVNVVLAFTKITVGLIGRSSALIADGFESTVDIFSSAVVWLGFRISRRPPDSTHPYGHGKAESISAVAVSAILLARIGKRIGSTSLQSDAWHHRTDALTSLAAFVGISIALLGGPGYEAADDWAALGVCVIIAFNGGRLLIASLNEVMDAAAPEQTQETVRRIATETDDVVYIEKCRVRKSGLGMLMDIHVVVDGNITVKKGHEIAHLVQKRLHEAIPEIRDVVVHIEPDDYE